MNHYPTDDESEYVTDSDELDSEVGFSLTSQEHVKVAQTTLVSSSAMAELEIANNDPFGILAYISDDSVLVIPEDKYSAEQCSRVFESFLTHHVRDRSPRNRMLVENALAEVCSKGTSAKRFSSRAVIKVDSAGLDATLGDFCVGLPSDRDNNLRVWCESRAYFADRTHKLIKAKDSLRIEVSKANFCSMELAPVAFDYAGSLSPEVYKGLGSVEKSFIALNTTRKTGPSRSHVFEAETADSGLPNVPMPADVKASQVRGALPARGASVGGMYGR